MVVLKMFDLSALPTGRITPLPTKEIKLKCKKMNNKKKEKKSIHFHETAE